MHIHSNQSEACLALIEAGADISATAEDGTTVLLMATTMSNSNRLLKAIVTHSQATKILDIQVNYTVVLSSTFALTHKNILDQLRIQLDQTTKATPSCMTCLLQAGCFSAFCVKA